MCEPVDVAKILRSVEDVTIIWRPLSGNVSGCFVRGKYARVILVNSARTLGHQNFTLAHEYHHLKYEPGLSGSVCSASSLTPRSPGERLADLFAASFLMPESALKLWFANKKGKTGRELSIMDIIDAEHFFGVSHQSMLIRLVEIGVLSRKASRELPTGIREIAQSIGYSGALYLPTNEKRMESTYARMAKEAADRGLITAGKYEQIMLDAGLGDLVYGVSQEGESAPDEDI